MSSWTPHLPALQVVVPLMTAPLVVLMGDRRLAWAMTTAASLCALAIAIALVGEVGEQGTMVYEMGSWAPPYGIALGVDAMSALLLLVVAGASTLGLLAAATSVSTEVEHQRQPHFYAAWLLALAGLSGILVTADAFNIFVFMEISSLSAYILIAGGPDRRALPAVFKYLAMGTIGATFYLIGVGLVYMMTGTLNLADMEQRLADVGDAEPILVAAGFITVGLALKAAIFPLHAWLPNAYTYAPNVVTVFLAACATKISIYVLIRFDFFVFQANLTEHDWQFSYFLMPLAVLGILIASAVAIFESNLKRLLAWSSVAQIGYIILGASLISVTGLTASMLHMFNHSIAKGTAFLALTCLALSISRLELKNIGGIAKQMPWTMAAFVVGGLSLIGVPGTAGFISKWYLISAALEMGDLALPLVAVILIGSVMAVIYVWRVVETAYFAKGTGVVAGDTIREAPLAILLPTWIAVLLNIWFGLAPSLPVELSGNAAELLMGHLR
ncbi:MAG: monovalent cation/H+ antiporter subunit D family protein [Gammaproteobacteria bacterium]|nr:monovalent cation/H+ antiporter subunit D family protein [Gammaproteobacteria bacterium]